MVGAWPGGGMGTSYKSASGPWRIRKLYIWRSEFLGTNRGVKLRRIKYELSSMDTDLSPISLNYCPLPNVSPYTRFRFGFCGYLSFQSDGLKTVKSLHEKPLSKRACCGSETEKTIERKSPAFITE